MLETFEDAHMQQFGFIAPEKGNIVEAITVEVVGGGQDVADEELDLDPDAEPAQPLGHADMYAAGATRSAPVYDRDTLSPSEKVNGPAVIIDSNATTVVEPGWQAEITVRNHMVINRVEERQSEHAIGTEADPVMLEVFNNLFMSIAEQMGVVLQNTSYSVNIKERLDFSCAIFDNDGQLVANAPHIPVHLGSMSESVQTIVRERGEGVKPGDVFVLNAPYNGGTHLPDVTVMTPVFDRDGNDILFYVASRGHHAEIGGKTPGSCRRIPAHRRGRRSDRQLPAGRSGAAPREGTARTVHDRTLSDAQFPPQSGRPESPDRGQRKGRAGTAKDGRSLRPRRRAGLHEARSGQRRRNGPPRHPEPVRRRIRIRDGFRCPGEGGHHGHPETRSATVDFTGTSPQQDNNFNITHAVAVAAVLYTFRLMVDDDIPLNAGCLKPLNIVVPEDCMLRPKYPAAVVAGNVETSQAITDTIWARSG